MTAPTWWLAAMSTVALIALGMWGCPHYQVYRLALQGEAHLREAEWNRQIAVKEAEAVKESAIALADVEIERARGVAQANLIIGESLRDNEVYLRYLWVQALDEGEQVIYVPTEAGLPILEAGKR